MENNVMKFLVAPYFIMENYFDEKIPYFFLYTENCGKRKAVTVCHLMPDIYGILQEIRRHYYAGHTL